jgi:hypothetical protein
LRNDARFGADDVAVGVGVHEQDDAVVQEPHRLLVGAAHHLVDHFAELLGAEHLGGVQAAVDPDDRLSLLRERAGLVVGQSVGVGEPAGDLLVSREVPVVLRRGDDRHQVRPALRGPPDFDDLDAIGLRFELVPVGSDLLVVGEEVVVAEVGAELFLRRGDVGLRRSGRGGESDGSKRDGSKRDGSKRDGKRCCGETAAKRHRASPHRGGGMRDHTARR